MAGNRSDLLTEPEDVVDRTPSTTAWISSRWWERNPVRVIVVPNEHVENMYGLEPALAGSIHEAARRIALALRRVSGCEGSSTRQHNEPAGYQEVWH